MEIGQCLLPFCSRSGRRFQASVRHDGGWPHLLFSAATGHPIGLPGQPVFGYVVGPKKEISIQTAARKQYVATHWINIQHLSPYLLAQCRGFRGQLCEYLVAHSQIARELLREASRGGQEPTCSRIFPGTGTSAGLRQPRIMLRKELPAFLSNAAAGMLT